MRVSASILALGLSVLGGCGGSDGVSSTAHLNSTRTDSQVAEIVRENFAPGDARLQVEATLDDLGVPRGQRWTYPADHSSAGVRLARLYPGRGLWLRSDDDLIHFVDLAFIFDSADSLQEVWSYRDSVRYLRGGLAYGPRRPGLSRARDFPAALPPPADPMLDAVRIVPP
jgi:hypothetical protein